jgi:hypothetical protein
LLSRSLLLLLLFHCLSLCRFLFVSYSTISIVEHRNSLSYLFHHLFFDDTKMTTSSLEDLRPSILKTRTREHISMLCYLRNYPFRRSSDTELRL